MAMRYAWDLNEAYIARPEPTVVHSTIFSSPYRPTDDWLRPFRPEPVPVRVKQVL